ncbi:MAG: hypothetical protein FD167_199 [bacterium]|nr:MAG: hypothetical protein FD167_199 [bacterium]
MDVPELTGKTNQELFYEAVEILKAFNGSADEKADLFDVLTKQITRKTNGSWTADREKATDGSHLFFGTLGHTLVITLSGQIWQGKMGFSPSDGVRPVCKKGQIQYEPDYSKLRRLSK